MRSRASRPSAAGCSLTAPMVVMAVPPRRDCSSGSFVCQAAANGDGDGAAASAGHLSQVDLPQRRSLRAPREGEMKKSVSLIALAAFPIAAYAADATQDWAFLTPDPNAPAPAAAPV